MQQKLSITCQKARGLDINDEALHQLKKLTRKDLAGGIMNPTKYYDLIVACLESGHKRGYKKGLTKNYRILGELCSFHMTAVE